MFFQFSGLSLLIHLAIIFFAWSLGLITGKKHISAFQTHGKGGGVVQNRQLNSILSLSIFFTTSIYMIGLLTLAISTGLRIGADEPQVIYMKWLGSAVISLVEYIISDSLFQMLILSAVMLTGLTYIYFKRVQLIRLVFKQRFIVIGFMHKFMSAIYTARKAFKRSPFFSIFFIFLLMVVTAIPYNAEAQIVEPGFESELVASGFSLATAMAFIPDGRILVAEKSGVIKVIKNAELLPEPLVDLTDVNSFGDRGLLGLAIDPNFASNGYIYLSYTYENSPGFNVAGPKTGRIVRLTVVGDTANESTKYILVGSEGGNVSTPSCEDYLVTADCIPSDSNSHSMGGLGFGPDNKLYATLGDGADFVAVDERALRVQNPDSLSGKMLRLNTDGTAPTDNPFYTGNPNDNQSKVYALGFRNSFRFNFHPVTGKLYAGDVGWGDWEEINQVTAGANYGWPCREGNFATSYGCTPSSTVTDPLYAYPHNASGAGSITGGAFMNSNAYPAIYKDSLFIGDYAQMWLKRLVLDESGDNVLEVVDFMNGMLWPVDISPGYDGNIYYLDIVYGTLNRLTHTSGNRRPVVQVSANPLAGLSPLDVNFSSAGSYDPDNDTVSYGWQFGDGATSVQTNPTHVYNNNGLYTSTLTVTDSHGSAASKSIEINVGNQAPIAKIISPASGTLYLPGQEIIVVGEGTDPETGAMPQSAYSWKVILHHNVHTHTLQQISGSSTITVMADDHSASDVYLEVELTVTDVAGLTNVKSILMYLNNGQGSGNLVSNPSMEVAGAVVESPLDWYQSWYGVMGPIFTYPVAGLGGEKAARIQVLSHESGNAKWYFSPVYVTSGAEYTFSNKYTATVQTELTAQFGKSDGTYVYDFLAILPAAGTPTPNLINFTVPAGVQTVTIFHEIGRIGELVVDDYSLTLASSTADIIPPTGVITNYVNGDIVSGVISVAVDANDNVGVTKMHIYVDGAKVEGIEDINSPYNLVWDTTTVPNGLHTIMAHIHDAAENHGMSAMVEIDVQNSTTTIVNLINNADFELANGTSPVGWSANSWGEHLATFNYPVVGFNGQKAARLEITQYAQTGTGDSKWVFTKIPVTPGVEYVYSDHYRSNTISDIIGQYTLADGSFHYFGLVKEIPPSSTWQSLTGTFTPPTGVTHVTLFHLISSVGYLEIDDTVLYENGTGTPSETNPPVVEFTNPLAGQTVSGLVNLTASSSDDTAITYIFYAVDGIPITGQLTTSPYTHVWDSNSVSNGSHVLKATTHDPSGNNSTHTITITVNNSVIPPPPPPPPTGNNLVLNGNLETAGTTGNPDNWNRGGWGTNTRTFTYPATGSTGNGATVAISGYVDGDAKWYFDEVPVVPGKEYVISDRYSSTVASETLLRYKLSTGAFQYQFLQSLPVTGGAWQTFSRNVTIPVNVQAVTIFHLIAGNGSLSIDDMSIIDPSATSTLDIVSPTTSITSPGNGSTASGTVSIAATASDNIAVEGVILLVNGVVVGSEDITAPYSFSWNSALVSNGPHTLMIRARDAAGNIGTSSTITITANNSVIPPPPPPTGNNLVLNGNLETPGTAGNPANWNRGGWGTNTRTFTYPATGSTGNGATVAISSYTDGDAKWYFDEVIVVPGQEYTFTHQYLASTQTNLTLRYRLTDGSFSYVGLGNLPATATWTSNSVAFTPLADVESVTVMHILFSSGSLTIDDHTLTTISSSTPFARGKVSFSFDDGWVEHYNLALPILNAAGLPGTFYIVSNEMLDAVPSERVLNSNLETLGTAGNPANWNRGGWGTNNRTFTYPASGSTGNGATVAITTYTGGDAKWYFDPVTVLANDTYIINEMYNSTVNSEILARFTMTGGAYLYQYIQGLPSTAGTWQNLEVEVKTPANATHLTLFHLIAGVGALTVDEVSIKRKPVYANLTQVLEMQAAGHEIGAHTKTHPALTTLNSVNKLDEISGSKSDLENAGLQISTMAYPYGDYDDSVKQIVASAGYTIGRSVDRGFNESITDRYALKIQQVARTRTLAEMRGWIDQAAAQNTWLVFMLHQISNDPVFTLGITEADFAALVQHAAASNVDVITVADGATLLNP